MKVKWIFLFFLLGLPVGIYLFLQGFGENRFDVPVYYQNGIENPIGNCESGTGQFIVPNYQSFDSSFSKRIEGITVFDLGTPDCDSCQLKTNNLLSVSAKFREWKEFHIESIVGGNSKGLYPTDIPNWSVHLSRNASLLDFANCGLNFEPSEVVGNKILGNGIVVLIDGELQIRGYYNLFDRKEADRLVVELGILKTNKSTLANETK